jgi:hypothetical protein
VHVLRLRARKGRVRVWSLSFYLRSFNNSVVPSKVPWLRPQFKGLSTRLRLRI